jgi:hypothetical protein
MIWEDRELLAELARLNTEMVPLAMASWMPVPVQMSRHAMPSV